MGDGLETIRRAQAVQPVSVLQTEHSLFERDERAGQRLLCSYIARAVVSERKLALLREHGGPLALIPCLPRKVTYNRTPDRPRTAATSNRNRRPP